VRNLLFSTLSAQPPRIYSWIVILRPAFLAGRRTCVACWQQRCCRQNCVVALWQLSSGPRLPDRLWLATASAGYSPFIVALTLNLSITEISAFSARARDRKRIRRLEASFMSPKKITLLSVLLFSATWVVAQAAPGGGAAHGGGAPGSSGTPGQTSPGAPPTGNTGQPPTGNTTQPPTGSTPGTNATPGSNPTNPNAPGGSSTTNPNAPNSTNPNPNPNPNVNPTTPGAPNGGSTNPYNSNPGSNPNNPNPGSNPGTSNPGSSTNPGSTTPNNPPPTGPNT